ncbi:MAG: c-type cytochrome [Mucilaginibacter sp.]|nr:c-type cytochrome [Mucilaginibacter sp.]
MKKDYKWLLGVVCASAVLFYTCKSVQKYVAQYPVQRDESGRILVDMHPDPTPKSPEEEMKHIYTPPGYHLQLVASEPMVSQPVAIAWDGDARMYVAELNTYMLDVSGSHEHDATCKIKLLEDTNGDGIMDKMTVFADNLVLPRTIQPLDHGRLLVSLTWTNSVFMFQDTDGDGVADKKTFAYENNGTNTNNLEHQKSGLIWNLDNRMYLTYDPVRYTVKGETVVPDTLVEGTAGQWGLANDDYGRLFFSSAGGEDPAYLYQQNIHYGQFDFRDRYDPEFIPVWPIVTTPDVQGGFNRLRLKDSTLNHFTASNGQSIFRGDKLPGDMKGDLFICEPVGRLIRRAKVTNTNGKVTLKNAYDKSEFLASTDLNFRPVNTITGPDGCMYIVDMYHGIIQESEWTKADSYLRPKIQQKGLEKNIGRGRIFRLVHDDYKPSKVKPHMLEETSAQLVDHLNSANGWWRDNAQKLLVLRGDKSVVPALKTLAVSGGQLARIHALWTLNGLDALDAETFATALKDKDAEVRKTTVWIGEDLMKKDNQAIDLLAKMSNDPSADVRFQLLLTMRFVNSAKSKDIIAGLIKNYPNDPSLAASQNTYENKIRARAEQLARQKLLNAQSGKLVAAGALIYKQLCFTCHGTDAKGIISNGTGMIAPPLAGNADVNTVAPDKLIRILLYGLSGPIRGTNYSDAMPALGGNDNAYIASVISYIRSDFGNKGRAVLPEDVQKIRDATTGRTKGYNMAELDATRPILGYR